jgi:tRNA(fMet)-specific endonuclease VapC
MSNQLFMIDTNIASFIIKGLPLVKARLTDLPMSSICISTITEAELLLGVAKKPQAKHLPILVKEFLLRVTIVPWNSDAATAYAKLRNASENEGKSLSCMDMLIAAHALAHDAVLVTNDKAFFHLEQYLTLEDWT